MLGGLARGLQRRLAAEQPRIDAYLLRTRWRVPYRAIGRLQGVSERTARRRVRACVTWGMPILTMSRRRPGRWRAGVSGKGASDAAAVARSRRCTGSGWRREGACVRL